jgi:RimJ/RimL family protein N-acetyltransferase
LSGAGFTLRELSVADAPSLSTHLSSATVGKYIAQPPQSVAGFRTFVRWTRTQRRRGTHLCFGLVPDGKTAAVGIIQVWPIEPDFSTAEWGFAIGEPFWGTKLFVEAAQLVLDFAFNTLGVLRLEARAVEANGRGNGVLGKLGAQPEGTLRSSFRSGNQIANHVMWAILAEDYHRRRQLGACHFECQLRWQNPKTAAIRRKPTKESSNAQIAGLTRVMWKKSVFIEVF